MYALDLDWQRVSVLWAACDPESQTAYLHAEYSARRAELAIHADAIRSRGKDLRGIMNPSARGRTTEEGTQLIAVTKKARRDGYEISQCRHRNCNVASCIRKEIGTQLRVRGFRIRCVLAVIGDSSMGKPKLEDHDFPVDAEGKKVVTREDEPVATADNEKLAEDIAERLNDDAWRRHEDNWSA